MEPERQEEKSMSRKEFEAGLEREFPIQDRHQATGDGQALIDYAMRGYDAGVKDGKEACREMAEFLSEWFHDGQAPIHPGTMVNHVETFDEVVAQFVREMRQGG
jgi:hypothetical protein